MNSLSDLIGKKIIKIVGGDVDEDQIDFYLESGEVIQMLHHQDCCESVSIAEIDDNIQCLVGGEITQFDETSNYAGDDLYESATWTFYNIATTTGFVNIRWLGVSNGYYSEGVTIQIKPENGKCYGKSLN